MRLILGESLAPLSGRKGGKGDDARSHDRDGCNDRGRHNVRIVGVVGIVCIVPLLSATLLSATLLLHPPPGVNST